ncbi:hypothetical protein ACFRAU_12690 [Arthrobacter sp. NPDC056691]|uniref:hypothetical protein n=1 Tax=Arthrobacter sp. NPDC056691 TaxID=3345913 RepID=UPI00366E9985
MAALILLDHPHGNRITPSRGDRGIDVQVETDGEWDIYQIKKFAQTLGTSQRNQIKKSWETFVSQTLAGRSIRSWTLVMPWDPTVEQHAWLADLTQGYDFEIRWWGLSQLDGLASKHPQVAEYYFGDGRQEITTLMANMLALTRDVSRDKPDDDLIHLLIERQSQITEALTQIDPFYRYVIDIRSGDVEDMDEDQRQRDARGAALVSYLPLSGEQYAVTRVLPLCAESSWLRPIKGNLSFRPEPGTSEHAALTDFLEYGTPFSGMPGELTEAVGPPGLLPPGPGTFSVSAMAGGADTPPLELQLSRPGFGVIQRLPLANVTVTQGPRGNGFAVTATDIGGSLGFTLKYRKEAGKGQETFQFKRTPVPGRYPGDIRDAVSFVAQFDGRNEINLGIKGGPPLTHPLAPDGGATSKHAQEFLKLLDDLLLIQLHTLTAIRVPDLSSSTKEEYDSWETVARLLRGETIEGRWESIRPSEIDPHDPVFKGPSALTMTTQEPMYVLLNGGRVELSTWMQETYSGGVLRTDDEGFVLVPLSEGTVTVHMIDGPSADLPGEPSLGRPESS